MDDSQIIALYWARSEQAITESETKYGNYCYQIAYNIISSRNRIVSVILDPAASHYWLEVQKKQNHQI